MSWDTAGLDGARSFDAGELWWDGGSSTTTTRPGDDTLAGVYHIGNYYNWNAATAGSGYTGTTNNYAHKYTATNQNQYPADSICPKGWKMPVAYYNDVGNASGSFGYLVRNAYGISATNTDADVIISPISLNPSGFYIGSNYGNQGAIGALQSATSYNSGNMINSIHFHNTGLNTANTYDKGAAYPIRCVAR